MTIMIFDNDERSVADVMAEYPGRRVIGRVVGGVACLVVL